MEKQDIYKKIEEKGKEEAKKIILAGEKEAEIIKKQILEQAENEVSHKREELSKFVKEQIVAKESVLKQNEKMMVLKDKKNIINDVLESAFKEMKKMSDKDLKHYVLRIIKSESITGDEVLLVSKDDYNRYLNLFSTEKGFKDLINLDLLNSELGEKYHLSLSNKEADIDGGFIIISKTYDVDGSFKAILQKVLDNNESEIAKILFSEGR